MRIHPECPAILARGLTKDFPGVRAVDRVDLQVNPGEVFGVLGPNGAGKTTMLRMLATLESITSGTAEIFGVDAARDPQQARHLIGVTGQFAAVDNGLTARENLSLFGRLHGLPRREVRQVSTQLLEEFSLADSAHRKVAEFSGGMRRRLDLAVSLISSPPLIFLDEPTTGLDPRTRNQMWSTVRGLVEGGRTVMLTTQYLEEADQLADRIAVIDRGRLVAVGTPRELKARVGGYRLRLELTERSGTEAVVNELQRIIPRSQIHTDPGEISCPLSHPGEAAGILSALYRQGTALESVTVSEPSLDEVFFALTGHDAPSEQSSARDSQEVGV